MQATRAREVKGEGGHEGEEAWGNTNLTLVARPRWPKSPPELAASIWRWSSRASSLRWCCLDWMCALSIQTPQAKHQGHGTSHGEFSRFWAKGSRSQTRRTLSHSAARMAAAALQNIYRVEENASRPHPPAPPPHPAPFPPRLTLPPPLTLLPSPPHPTPPCPSLPRLHPA